MASFVTDTHALVWHLTRDLSLSDRARAVFEAADAGRETVVVPSIVLVEALYLVERARVPADLVTRILDLLTRPGGSYRVAALDAEVALALRAIGRNEVPDMPDRIIATTAQVFGLPLLTRDARIASVGSIRTVW